MRRSVTFLCSMGLLGLLGCGQAETDASRVLVNVGGSKITERELGALVKVLIKDPAQAQAFLTSDEKKAERLGLLEQLAATRAVYQMAKAEGLDQDVRVKARVDAAVAEVYFKSMLERRAGALEPTENDLKTQYQAVAAQAKAMGQKDLPPFEQVKDQVAARWRQEQQQRMVGDLQKELQDKVPVTFLGEGAKKP